MIDLVKTSHGQKCMDLGDAPEMCDEGMNEGRKEQTKEGQETHKCSSGSADNLRGHNKISPRFPMSLFSDGLWSICWQGV